MAPDYALPFQDARWTDVLPRHVAFPELGTSTLLHAGPPLAGELPAPVRHAAVQAVLFEDLAATPAAALDLIQSRRVTLRPAQDVGIATPLAQVVSASMWLFAVRQGAACGYAPLTEGAAPALRFGDPAPSAIARLREVSDWVGRAIGPLVRRSPVSITALIRAATAAGDECHARTAVANDALATRLTGLDADSAARLRAYPGFVLPLLMAAGVAALRARGAPLAAIGGNGLEFGVRHQGARHWTVVPADPPRGSRFPDGAGCTILPAIGDSAVLDFCGLGGQALACAPLLLEEWRTVLPADAVSRRERLVDPGSGIIDPRRISATGLAPLINLAMLDAAGIAGLIGRGFYEPPASLFAASSTPFAATAAAPPL